MNLPPPKPGQSYWREYELLTGDTVGMLHYPNSCVPGEAGLVTLLNLKDMKQAGEQLAWERDHRG